MRIALLTCALCALGAPACGGSDNRPAAAPSLQPSAMNAPASGMSSSAVAYDSTTAAQTATSTAPPQDVSGSALPSNDITPLQTIAPMPSRTPSDVRPATPSPSGAPAANGPGGADQTSNADNTKMNNRDRHDALTPMKQGNSGDEVKITAAIRRAVMSDKSLSFTAKNVKIITVGTKVTLRGPVNSEAEKAAVEARARETPGVTEVDDQIEVKK